MYESKNPLSALSYTNKDFQTIYPELLETVKKLSYKWDPTISNESDPGVILLKLNAIIADKNNYNIDKNILENYPETYTQMFSARSQYRQLGYRMPWYRAATTNIRFRWVDNANQSLADGDYVVIPRHTTLTDSDNDKIFTTLHDLTIGKIDQGDGTGVVEAIQGVMNTLTIAGNDNITLRNLDSQNRLYINDYNIAENGIFVTNSSDVNNNLWQQVDNVEVQPSGTTCYEFDIDARNNICYLQFPDDINNLIGSGITVKYIITRGYEGNVAAKVINKFYQEPELKIMNAGLPVSDPITVQEHIMLYNNTNASNGSDPETIEEAYKSYKRVVGTFNTLVTLRDYVNALCASGYVSNAVVTDRTNDIQSTLRIVDRDPNAIETHQTHVMDNSEVISYTNYSANDSTHAGKTRFLLQEDNTLRIIQDTEFDSLSEDEKKKFVYVRSENSKKLDAFDLKFYVLSRGNVINNMDEYDTTFDIDETPSTLYKLNTYIESQKSLQHDVQPIEVGPLFMLQNVYPIRLKIVPTHKLSNADIINVSTNIQVALRDTLNSRKLEFGEAPQYDVIYDTIANSDERIKVVIMDDFDYTTYAVYIDDKGRTTFNGSYQVDGTDNIGGRVVKKVPINNFDAENIILLPETYQDRLEHGIVEWFQSKATIIKDDDKKDVNEYIFIDPFHGKMYLYDRDLEGCNIYLYSDKINEFRQNILAKNILAGVTPLYDAHTTFSVSLDMQQDKKMSVKTDKISTSLKIAPFGLTAEGESVEYDNKVRDAEYTLKDNENLRFLAPSFITDKNYSNYVKYELVMKAPTGKEEYVYADPKNADDILRENGTTNFYQLNSAGEYKKVNSVTYKNLEPTVPRLRADCFFTGNAEGTNVNNLSPLNVKLVVRNSTDEEVPTVQEYTPDFEPLMYYEYDTTHSLYKLLVAPPNDWDSYFDVSHKPETAKYHKLKQYVAQYLPVAFDVGDSQFIESYPYSIENYHRWKKTSEESADAEGAITTEREFDFYIAPYNKDLNYFDKDHQPIDPSNLSKYAKDTNEAKVDWCKYVLNNVTYTVDNLVINSPNNKECYDPILGKFTNTYVKSSQPQRSGTDVVYYRMVYGAESVRPYHVTLCDTLETSEEGQYVNQENFNNTFTEDTTHSSSVYTRYVINGSTTYSEAQKCVPAFVPGKYYRQTVINDNTQYIEYSKLYYIPSDWSNNYTSYCEKAEEVVGVGLGSVQYKQWLAGSLTLYIKQRTYKVSANTDYQLREGDYITFFWRESDEDNAPYQYIKYDHIYDKDNGLPTIIRPNFNMNASNYANCKIKPTDLASSNVVSYDAAESSPFQIILRELYGDYDLSGTKQIDLRKINSRALDKTNYIYFISNEQDDKNDEFVLRLQQSQIAEDKKSATYTYIVQNDEYFVYTNSRKDAFEVLGAGTLIKLTRKVEDTNKTIDNVTNGTELEFRVSRVKISDVMFYGIDTFKDQCEKVYAASDYTDSWLLVEQQIYSFTGGDTIIIHMDDAETKYVECDSNEWSEGRKVYKRSDYVKVLPCYEKGQLSEQYNEIAPPYLPGVYFEWRESGEDGPGYYPIDKEYNEDMWKWENVKNFYTAGKDYTLLTSEPTDFEIEYNKYYIKDSSVKYPVFSTTYENASDAYVSGYTVSYKSNGSVAEKLPTIDMLDSDYRWNVTANLNLNFDKDHAQCIIATSDENDRKSEQSVTIEGTTFNSKDNDTPLYLLSDVSIDKVGGNNVDVSYVTADSEDTHKVEILAYKINQSLNNGAWGHTNSGELKHTIYSKDHQIILGDDVYIGNVELDIEEGFGYLLPVYTYNSNLQFKLVDCNTGADLIDKDMNTDYRSGIRYYDLDPSMNLMMSYKFTKTPDSNADIIFGSLFRYKLRDLFKKPTYYGITQKELEKTVRIFDVPKCFKYNHIVDDSIKISDPLDGASFFDENHVHNKFTIVKADLRFARDTGANITFVNNR